MRKIIIYATLVLMYCVVFIKPVHAKSPLDSVKIVVADYLTKVYGDYFSAYLPQELNRRFDIYDILTKDRVENDIKNGRIYLCSVKGDDFCGIYLLLENNSPKLVKIENIPEFKVVWDFMRRNGYTLEQIDSSIKYMTSNYEYEESIRVH